MYAVVDTGGKQAKVEKDAVIAVKQLLDDGCLSRGSHFEAHPFTVRQRPSVMIDASDGDFRFVNM